MSRRELLKEALMSFGGSAKIDRLVEYVKERDPKFDEDEVVRILSKDPEYLVMKDKVIYLD